MTMSRDFYTDSSQQGPETLARIIDECPCCGYVSYPDADSLPYKWLYVPLPNNVKPTQTKEEECIELEKSIEAMVVAQ